MLEYTNGDPFKLQARTGNAFNDNGQPIDTGTVFTGFAASHETTQLQISLNDNRTHLSILVNGSAVDLDTLRTDGYNSTDIYFTLTYNIPRGGNAAASEETAVTAVFSNRLMGDTSFKVTFKQGILDLSVYGPREYANTVAGRGLLGRWNNNPDDDFLMRNGTILRPANAMNITEAQIFEFGQTWAVTEMESLFDYGQRNWAFYNQPDFTPPFLDQILNDATEQKRTAAESACGDNRECLFDNLAVSPTLGADSMATGAKNKAGQQNLENFPPAITDIVEIGATNALSGNNTLCVVVGEMYILRVAASDPNENDVVTFAFNGSAPSGASIDQNGRLEWTPVGTEMVSLEILVSDGVAQSSVALYVKVCQCNNNGSCDFSAMAPENDLNENRFAVVMCDCTPGWAGTHCQEDENACEGGPCFEGVICYDDPPPATEPRCGPCPATLTGDGMTCFDVDECADGSLNACEQICENTKGSYICSCTDGYSLSLDRHITCTDNDECMLGTHDCLQNSVCNNNDGGYTCTCAMGYSEVTDDGKICEDIDECVIADICDESAFCENTNGSYACVCPDGFIGDGRNCTDEDECRLPDVNNCDVHATCINEIGYFQCSCNEGWSGNGFDGNCTDIDECTEGTHTCSPAATCSNLDGAYMCECMAGYVGNGKTCLDVNECNDNELNTCLHGSECINTDGSFACPCLDGFTLSNGSCIDVNECDEAMPSRCSDNAVCTNTDGSFTCQCNEFYQGNGFTCEDINECELRTHDCSQNCENLVPGFKCGCNFGFTLDMSDNKSCEVITDTECDNVTAASSCGENTVCIFLNGTPTCFCNRAGFDLVDNRTCADLNECEDSNPCESFCNNTDGSFFCSCDMGYDLEDNQRNCSDIDECTDTGRCDANADCINTDGSYECQCRSGYNGTAYGPDSCNNINECENLSLYPCGNNTDCKDTNGSYTCTCRQGFSGDGHICVDMDECLSSPCDEHAVCVNTKGSYSCTCHPGFEGNGTTCQNINECTPPNDYPCSENAQCNDTTGSFVCTCNTGFRGDPFVECVNIDECAEIPNLCHSEAICTDKSGSYSCSCKTGYQGDGIICEDLNECTSLTDFCQANSYCNNTIGSAFCTCEGGFELGNGTCKDFDECSSSSVNSCAADRSRCVNTAGDYTCDCFQGFTNVTPKTCEDVNECTDGTHNCSMKTNSMCVNIEGSFSCECKEMFAEINGNCVGANTLALVVDFDFIKGFSVSSDPQLIERRQTQIDLAADVSKQLRNSSDSAILQVTVSNYTVLGTVVRVAFRVDVAINASAWTEDYLHSAFRSGLTSGVNRLEPDSIVVLEDEDECEITDICGNGICINTDGSYECMCFDGYGGSGDICEDLNECLSGGHYCSQVCLNERGGFSCDCFVGYTLNSDGGNCSDINECLGDHGCEQMCINTDGSYWCECAPGYSLHSNGRNCSDINECLGDHGCEQMCINMDGSYGCECTSGYSLHSNGRNCSVIESTTRPTNATTTTMPTTPEVTAMPTMQADTTMRTTPEVTTIPTAPSATTVTPTPSATTIPLMPAATTMPTGQADTTMPTTSTSSTQGSPSQSTTEVTTTVQTAATMPTSISSLQPTSPTTVDTTHTEQTASPTPHSDLPTTIKQPSSATSPSTQPPTTQTATTVVPTVITYGSSLAASTDKTSPALPATNGTSTAPTQSTTTPSKLSTTSATSQDPTTPTSISNKIISTTENTTPATTTSSSTTTASPTTTSAQTVPQTTSTSCPDGQRIRNNVCTAFGRVTASLKITNIDSAPAFVTAELLDRTGPTFKKFEADLAAAVIQQAGLSPDNTVVTITDIRNGSIVVDYSIEVYANSSEEVLTSVQDIYMADLTNLEANGTMFQVDPESVRFIGPTVQPTSPTSAATAHTSASTPTSNTPTPTMATTATTTTTTTTTTATTTISSGLQAGAIIGIVLGTAAFFLMLITTCCCCLYCLRMRQRQAGKAMMSFQGSQRDHREPMAGSMMYHDGEYLYNQSLDDRHEIMRRAMNEIRRDNSSVAGSERSVVRNPRWGPSVARSVAPSEGSVARNPRHAQENYYPPLEPLDEFITPYVADGSEASTLSTSRTQVSRNPMHEDRRYQYF